MRTIGPWLPEHRTGQANLRAAFPEKSDAEIETILRGVWDNLGRTGAEIAHLDHICSGDRYKRTFIDYTPESIERFLGVINDGKPAVVFAAHLANWELPAVIAASDGLESTVLYRRPNLGAVADAVIALRKGIMGEMVASSLGAPVTLARALERGRHVAMLVDQHYVRGIDVTFFGRTCKVNPLIAMLAREAECPIHGTRVWRLPGNRFGAEISPEVPPVRDAEGRIDVAGTMQADHLGGRVLGARASRTVAVAAPAMAVAARSDHAADPCSTWKKNRHNCRRPFPFGSILRATGSITDSARGSSDGSASTPSVVNRLP